MADPFNTILTSEFAIQYLYPFLLIFTIVFAILEKTKILGDGKKQIDAIVALVVGLIGAASLGATTIIVELMPVLAVAVVVLFVFLVIWGFVATGEKGLKIHKGIQLTVGILVVIVLVIALIIITGNWDRAISFIFEGEMNIWGNVLLLAIIGGAIAIVLSSGKKSDSSSSE